MSQGEYLEGYGSNLEENYWESELSQRNCHERRKVKKKNNEWNARNFVTSEAYLSCFFLS